MRKRENLFISAILLAGVATTGITIWRHCTRVGQTVAENQQTTKYGAFLAAQHAIYVNDFDRAAFEMKSVSDTDYPIIENTRIMSEFLSGRMPDGAAQLSDEGGLAARLIYDTHLVTEGNWDELYKRHKNDESALAAPLRVWSSVATGRTQDALKFIKKLPTNESWKSFVTGQIYAETGNIEQAATEFEKVRPEFMNINDYLYLMAFFRAHDMDGAAEKLRVRFTAMPGGMFMAEFCDFPDWNTFSGFKNALAFSLVQNVSHTQIMMYSDLAILLLRFAQIVGHDFSKNGDAVNYYLGQFFFNNTGDWATYFETIKPQSPFYPFAVLRMAEKRNDINALQTMLDDNPLFVSASNVLVAKYIEQGEQKRALRVVNRALKSKNLGDDGRAFFKKSRAHIYFVFGNLDHAQSDLHDAAAVLSMDDEILSLQAKIWAAQNREIENAYDYAMAIIKRNPTDVMAWDTLGRVVAAREGADEALKLLERVGEVSNSNSALFENIGDQHNALGNTNAARDAYMRALELSGDGLTVVPQLKKKIRKLK